MSSKAGSGPKPDKRPIQHQGIYDLDLFPVEAAPCRGAESDKFTSILRVASNAAYAKSGSYQANLCLGRRGFSRRARTFDESGLSSYAPSIVVGAKAIEDIERRAQRDAHLLCGNANSSQIC
jgi:hypothetical protein